MGRSKKLGLASYMPIMKSIPVLPPGLSFGVQSCLAMERGAVGGREDKEMALNSIG